MSPGRERAAMPGDMIKFACSKIYTYLIQEVCLSKETSLLYVCTLWPKKNYWNFCFSSVQSLGRVRLFATPWTIVHQASLSITNTQSSPKPMSIESMMPSNHLILCHPLLLLPSIFPSISVFSKESALCIRWPKDWSFSFNISSSNEHPGLISFRIY